ncbi:MAG TPA: DUF378 domain-containing protein [Patescibacteria group bacterium]|nr:DUF378 domain-containing protein [Patescibacteria group bacterium]
MKSLYMVATWLLVVGGLLWGYEGLTHTDLLMSVLGMGLADIVEVLVGLSAVWVGYNMLTGKKMK